MDEQEQLATRAMRAYLITAKRNGVIPPYPGNASSIEERDGKYYVVLRNENGILAVYRVKNDARLKRLKRWPKTLEEQSHHPSVTKVINVFGTLLPIRVKVEPWPKSLEQDMGCRHAI